MAEAWGHRMKREQAETVALEALAFVAGDERALAALVAETGVAPADLSSRAGEPELLAAVLDFLLGREDLLLRYCDERDLKPETVWRARMRLPGAPTEA